MLIRVCGSSLQQLLRLGHGGHRVRPAGIEREVRDQFEELFFRDAVLDRPGKMKAHLFGLAVATSAAQVMRLRSRFESCGRSQTSPNSTFSVISKSFGADSASGFFGGTLGAARGRRLARERLRLRRQCARVRWVMDTLLWRKRRR